MKILLVSHYFWPENFRVNDLAVELKNRGHEITVLTGLPNYPEGKLFEGYSWKRNAFREELWQGIRIIRAPLIPRGRNSVQLFLNYLSFVFFGAVTCVLNWREDFDLVFVYQLSPVTVALPAMLMKALSGRRLVHYIQDIWPETLEAVGVLKSPLLLRCVELMVRIIYRSCDRILVQSRAFNSSLSRLGVSQEKVVYLPNTAEDFYQPVELSEDAPERRVMPEGFRVVFAGSIGAAQDFPTILAAAEKLLSQAHIHWVILGDGRLRSWLEGEIERRGLRSCMHLLGRYPSEQMPRFFALADALLVTLRREPVFALTIPSKVQSYLACARPIVAALEGEGGKVVEESGAGFSCMPEDADGLAEIVLRLSKTPLQEREKMGRRGREYFDRMFDREKLIDRIEHIFLRESRRFVGPRS